MNSDLKAASDINSDNIIDVTMEDLSEDYRLEIERALEEQRKMMLAGFQKTRSGIIKKAAMPSASNLLGAEVTNSTE